ncbi:MAG: biotin/lipoyl-binding protein [Pirellulales bacterium]|nr:biotin/lipoyl-binding protein [Pirellulales bacterium]
MVTLRDSLLSSSARKLTLRKRPDLSARRQHYLGRTYWVVKDPVGLQYFRFQEEEFAILNMLDGETSLDEIKERFEAEFPPQKITLEELQHFLGMLHRSGLIIADVPGQGHQLRKRRDQRKRRELFQNASNILCIRFKGVDPERFLNWLYPFVRWFFCWPTVVCCMLLVLSALTLVIVEFDVFRSKLPEFHQFFNVGNAFWLALALGFTKACHELGHGLCCKHFGGECHEIGILILVLTPCPYCNVSDSWMLPSKWQRAAIGAAGMYVEIVLASICTFLWWFSYPDLLFNKICLDVMFISSITTILFNANPLLRYDGYYILSDLIEIPNMRQKATSITGRKLGEWFLGLEMPEDPFLPHRRQGLFFAYTVAAVCYRWFITFSICFFLYRLFDSYNLKRIGQLVVLMSIWALFFMPMYQLGKFFYVPGRFDKVKKPRMYLSLGVLGALALFVLFVPLPRSVIAPLEIQARNAESVYVEVPGLLESIEVAPGQRVAAGQTLAVLRNPDLKIEVQELRGAVAQYQRRLESLQLRRSTDPEIASQIPPIEAMLESANSQLRERETDLGRLTLTAPVAGVVLPPNYTPRVNDPDGPLPGWSGTPLERQNLGAFLDNRVLFCQIGDPKKLEAVMVLDQTDRSLVKQGQTVKMKIEGLPHQTFESVVEDVAPSPLKEASRRMSGKHGGEVSTKTDPDLGIERPILTSYQADAPLDDENGALLLGLRGTARIRTAPLPLGARFWRFVTHTFNFKL